MHRYQRRFIITLLCAAVVGGAYHFALRFLETPQVSKGKLKEARLTNSSKGFSPCNGGPVIVPKDRSLKSFSGDELQALANEFVTGEKENKETKIREKEYVVDSGSTVVTEGYESQPGVFVFTTMKFWITDSASDPQIAFKLGREMISLNGDYKVLADEGSELKSGLGGYGSNNDKYRVHLKGWILPDGRKIKVQVKESEFAHGPSVTVTRGRLDDPEP